jgi:dTDP-4-amino-4,6-dideoxygalactose transaminase
MNFKVNLFYPYVNEKARQLAYDRLGERWIGEGEKVKEFEKVFAEKFRLKNCVAVVNGTAGLHLAYILAGINSETEVITTALTCSATNIPLLYLTKWQNIIFADIDPQTLNISPKDIEKKITDRTRAIICMHWGGYPCEMQEITKIAKKHNLIVIEDAAQAIGAKAEWTIGEKEGEGMIGGLNPIGDISDYTVFSFQAIKNLTSVDGGMIVIKDDELYQRAKLLRWYGIDREWQGDDLFWKYQAESVGYKYHMNDVTACIGLGNLEDIDKIIWERKRIYEFYEENLNGIQDLTLLKKNKHQNSYWLFTCLVEKREEFKKAMTNKGIEVSEVHIRNDIMPIFGGFKRDLLDLNEIEKKYISLPLHNKMTLEDADYIVSSIKEGW